MSLENASAAWVVCRPCQMAVRLWLQLGMQTDALTVHFIVSLQMTGELAGIYYPLGGMTKEQEDKLQVGPCGGGAAAAVV